MATAWQASCIAALDKVPDLRGVEIRADGDRGVTAYAGPPIQKFNLSIQISRQPGVPVDWQEHVESLAGRNHYVWHHRTATTEVAILLDGWERERAERIQPVLQAGVEPCLR